MLKKLFDLGAKIPKPIMQIDDAILMELLGDEDSIAPRLSDVRLSAEEAQEALSEVLENVDIFWDSGIVHADLSAFNILWWQSHPYIIDFPQAVDVRTHPDAQQLLQRDLKNVIQYFRKYIEIDEKNIAQKFI
jgi:RIO kinase 1